MGIECAVSVCGLFVCAQMCTVCVTQGQWHSYSDEGHTKIKDGKDWFCKKQITPLMTEVLLRNQDKSHIQEYFATVKCEDRRCV